MTKDKILKAISAVMSILIMIALIVVFLISFQRRMMNLLAEITVKNISETQELYAESLRNKINDQIKTLDAQAAYFFDTDISNVDEVKRKATFSISIGDFKRIAVINKDGVAVDLNGKLLPNMKDKPYVIDALAKNQIQFSNRVELDENLNPNLVMAYPFETRNGEKGVITGFLSYDVLKQIFSISIFSGQSYFYLIATDGTILLFNKEKTKNLYNIDVYEYIKAASGQENMEFTKFKIDMARNQSGYMTLDGVEGKKLFSYAPLGLNGWYIISALPYSYIYTQQDRINHLVFGLLVGTIITILFFLLIIYLIIRRSMAIQKDNSRLTFANNQAQTLIFEYDIPKQTVDFSGDTHFILGTEKKNFGIDFIRAEYYPRIHPEDSIIMEYLKASIQNCSKSFSAEFRLKSFTGDYFWVKMTGSPILDENGKVSQFIGSITNVNSQILHEQELRNLADRDRLSYLLNKVAFERSARDYLKVGGSNKICALIIIDLDNFKDINDNLGHMTGDLVIKDTAKKLSMVFSGKDYIGRFGGDEFCILMRFDSALNKENIIKILNIKGNDLVRSLKEEYVNGNQSVIVSASIGIALYPDNGLSYEELFMNADHALYDVKQHGKNSYKICE